MNFKIQAMCNVIGSDGSKPSKSAEQAWELSVGFDNNRIGFFSTVNASILCPLTYRQSGKRFPSSRGGTRRFLAHKENLPGR